MPRNLLNIGFNGRNLLNTGDGVTDVLGGDAINVVETDNQIHTVNLKISKQSANTSLADTDVMALEESGGAVKKITGAHLKTSTFSSNWTRSSGNIFPTVTGDTILANDKIEIDTLADATYLDSLILQNTNAGTDVLTYSFQLKDAGSSTAPDFGGRLNFEVVYTKGGGSTNNVYEVTYDGFMRILKRLEIGDGFTANSGEDYDFPSTGGTLVTNTAGTITGTLPISVSTAGVVSTAFTVSSTDNLSNKTFTTATTFNNGLYTKYSLNDTTSGYVRFYEATDDGGNYIDLHPQEGGIASNINVFLPNSTNNTVLVGRDTTDTLTNKTINTILCGSSDFQIKESDNTNVFKYTASNGYVDFANTASTRMNFEKYTLHGSGTAYPAGVSMPFGTINSMYVDGAWIDSLTTDNVTVSEYQASPATTSSSIRCDSSSRVYLTGDKLKIGNILGSTYPTVTSMVEDTQYGWKFRGRVPKYQIRLGNRVWMGNEDDEAATGQYNLYVGTGDAYQITNNLEHKALGNTFSCANNYLKFNYSADRCFFSCPVGTNQNDSSFPGSFLAYHQNATELYFNCPNDSYDTTNSSNIAFAMAGNRKQAIFGSTNPAVSYYKTDGSTIYANLGMSGTFPANFGEWSSQSVPNGDILFYIGGANTNDTEGYFMGANGQGNYISSTGDDNALNWYDEDIAPTAQGWYISVTGTIGSISDKRFKTDIKTYKNSNFEKFKQIRTITYKKKKPKLSQKRLEKKSCIDKYNNIHYGVIAQDFYSLYPELEPTESLLKLKKWEYRRDNWDKGVYEKEYDEWKTKKEEYEKCNCEKDCEDKFKEKPPTKDFTIEEPQKVVDYQRLNILTIGVVQDLIKTIEDQQKIINKLVSANSFKDFKSSI